MTTLSRTLFPGIAIAMLTLSQATLADDFDCPPDLDAVTIDGNVLVSGDCQLNGTTVKGNVHIYAGGTLTARGAHIDGNIQAENANEVDVVTTTVGGSIQLDGLVGDSIVLRDNEIDGSIQLDSNRSYLDIGNNLVGADIQAFSNTGGLDITGNVVDGNLQCKENQPLPTGGGNTVNGNKEDQCANLTAGTGGGGGGGGESGGDIDGDVDCTDVIGAVTVDGNILVSSPDCQLLGTTVKGNVLLYSGGAVVADGATIIGNVQADDAFEVEVRSSGIEGSIQLDRLVGDVSVVDNAVNGSIQLNDNRFMLLIDGNDVGADIQAFGNTGGVDITDNTVDGNLQCKENNPAPTGGGNVVQGNKEDQCADLQLAFGAGAATGGSGGGNTEGGGTVTALGDAGSGGGSSSLPMLVTLLLLLGYRTLRRPTR